MRFRRGLIFRWKLQSLRPNPRSNKLPKDLMARRETTERPAMRAGCPFSPRGPRRFDSSNGCYILVYLSRMLLGSPLNTLTERGQGPPTGHVFNLPKGIPERDHRIPRLEGACSRKFSRFYERTHQLTDNKGSAFFRIAESRQLVENMAVIKICRQQIENKYLTSDFGMILTRKGRKSRAIITICRQLIKNKAVTGGMPSTY